MKHVLQRTAPILMKLGQNSVWCLIRSSEVSSKNPKRVHVLAAGTCFRLTGEPLVRTPYCRVSIDAWFYSFCSRTFLKPIKTEKPKKPKNPKFRI
eukprot:sb/3479303/